MLIYQNTDFYFFRKPNWLASTFGKEKSFLDYVFGDQIDLPKHYLGYKDLDNSLLEYISQQIQYLEIIKQRDQKTQIIQDLINTFNQDKEFGLLNRLDNDTWWLLYFAKTLAVYNNYKTKQDQDLLQKFYITQVNGNPFFKTDAQEMLIDYPIMHHKFAQDRMICLVNSSDIAKWDWKQHLVSTKISLLNFDKTSNISTLLVSISKWIRHQIRVHLNSIWCPIIWDKIYSNQKTIDFLHLRSVWFR